MSAPSNERVTVSEEANENRRYYSPPPHPPLNILQFDTEY